MDSLFSDPNIHDPKYLLVTLWIRLGPLPCLPTYSNNICQSESQKGRDSDLTKGPGLKVLRMSNFLFSLNEHVVRPLYIRNYLCPEVPFRSFRIYILPPIVTLTDVLSPPLP